MGLKIHIGSDRIHACTGVCFHLPAQRAGQLCSTFNGAHALAIRGIRQHDGLLLCGKVGHISHFKVAALFHTGQLCIGVGQSHSGRVDIIAKGFKAHIQLGLGQCLLTLLCPDGCRHKAIALGGKAALQAGGNVHGFLSSFDQQRAAAAEGVLHQTVAAHTAKVCNGSRQSLADGCLHGVAAVAALVQAVAGGVQHDLTLILAQHEADLVLRAGLRQHRGVVLCHQALDHSFFDDALAGRHTGQLAVQRRAGDRKGCVCGQQLLPRDIVHAVEQVIKGGGPVAGQQQHHALHRAQIEVCSSDHLCAAGKAQTAIVHADILCADAGQLKFCSGFTPKKAGRDQFKFCRHCVSFLLLRKKQTCPIK